mgnify:CR=1 FL=1
MYPKQQNITELEKRENEGADFILEVGSHIRFKRKLFEDYLDTASTV